MPEPRPLLYSAAGSPLAYAKPTPNAFLIERVNRELAESYDPLLHIRWIEYSAFIHGEWEGRYALCCWWPDADKRKEWVQQGKHPAADAFDIIGWLCEDMQDANSVPQTEEAMSRLIGECLGKMDNVRYPWKQRMMKSMEKNRTLVKARKQAVAELMENAMKETYGIKSMRHGPKTNDPDRYDWKGLARELEQEVEQTDF